MRAVRQFLWSHRLPLIAVALATLNSLLFWSLGPRVPLGLFIAAVMVSAWQGGMRPAVFATALSVLLLAVIGHYQAPGPGEDLVLRLGLFVLVGLIAGYLSQQCRQAIRAVDHVHEILGGSGIALISADAEGHVTSLNPLARTLTGLGDADPESRPLAQVFRVIHGPGRLSVPLPLVGTAQELPEGAVLVGANGTETAIEGSIGPVRDSDGRPSGVMVVFREAGGRSEAWQELGRRADRFRALAGYAPAGLMVLDAEGRCVFSNPAAQAACGCTADESLGEGWSRHVRPQDRDHLIGDWLRAVVAKQAFADEFQVVNGTAARWLRVRSAPMLADGGEVLGHVAALEELTEHRRAEEALADARRESEEQLQEWAAAEQKAAEELKAVRAAADEVGRKAQKQLDEQGTLLRRAEEALAAAHAEAEQKLREAAAGQRKTEEEPKRARAKFEKTSAEAQAARQQAEEELARLREEVARLNARPAPTVDDSRVRAVRDAWREEVEAVVAMHLGARARLAEELAGHRDAHEQLRSVLAERDGAAKTLRVEMDRLISEAGATREAHDRLQALLAERGGAEESLRKELERLSHEAGEAHEAHAQARAALVEKEKMEEALRQELERLREEAAGRRQAEEAHEGLRVQLGERDRREESLRGDKEFLDGIIDSSPVGIFAHDRDGRCRVWNAALERLLNRPRAEALGRTTTELFPPEESRGADEGAPPAENGALRAGLPAEIVLSRSEFFETSHAAVRDAAGEVIGGMTLVRQLPQSTPTGESATTPHRDGAYRLTPRLGDIDWLAFN